MTSFVFASWHTLEVFVTKGFEIADISQKLLSMYGACMQTIIGISVRGI